MGSVRNGPCAVPSCYRNTGATIFIGGCVSSRADGFVRRVKNDY